MSPIAPQHVDVEKEDHAWPLKLNKDGTVDRVVAQTERALFLPR